MSEGESGVAGKVVAMRPRGHGFKHWKQTLAKMWGKVAYNKFMRFGPSLNPTDSKSFSATRYPTQRISMLLI